MKLLFKTLLIVFVTKLFAQEQITNFSHPFQVLFVDSAFYLGDERSVNQFDFIEKYDLIRNKGTLVLVHSSGKILELKEKVINVREIYRTLETDKHQNRPLISNPQKGNNKHHNRESLSATDEAHICLQKNIELRYPLSISRSKNDFIVNSKNLYLAWEYLGITTKTHSYHIRFSNIFDEVIYETTTENPYFVIPVDSVNNRENLVVFSVKRVDDDFQPDYFGIRIGQKVEKNKYELIVHALELQWKDLSGLANELFIESIKESNNDPRFILLYNEFLKQSQVLN